MYLIASRIMTTITITLNLNFYSGDDGSVMKLE